MIDILYGLSMVVTYIGFIFITLFGLWHLVDFLYDLIRGDKDE